MFEELEKDSDFEEVFIDSTVPSRAVAGWLALGLKS